MITMKEIAQECGISSATVSKIINGNDEHISEATRALVLQTIKKYNYVPNAVAKGLKVKRTNTIGFILPDISNPFFPEIARGVEDAAESCGFAVTFCDTDNDPKRELTSFQLLRSKMVDGVIFTRTLRHSSFDDYLSVNLPIVVVDRRVETTNRNVGKLFVDTFHASRQATEHLIARGCGRIGFVGAANDYDDVRYLCYCSALEEAGLRVEDALCYKSDYSVETGHRGMKAIISAGMPDGVFCGNDLIAVGAMAEIHSMGFTIPTDVRVVGFDDIYLSRYLRPALTTVRQPAYDMGFEAAKMLISHITEGTPLCTLKMKHELIIREST